MCDRADCADWTPMQTGSMSAQMNIALPGTVSLGGVVDVPLTTAMSGGRETVVPLPNGRRIPVEFPTRTHEHVTITEANMDRFEELQAFMELAIQGGADAYLLHVGTGAFVYGEEFERGVTRFGIGIRAREFESGPSGQMQPQWLRFREIILLAEITEVLPSRNHRILALATAILEVGHRVLGAPVVLGPLDEIEALVRPHDA